MKLKYKPPVDWQRLLGFLAPRAIRGVESIDVEAKRLRRTLRFEQQLVLVECCVDEGQSYVSLSAGGQVTAAEKLATIVFDLEAPVEALAEYFPQTPGIRVPGAWDEFEMGVRAILGQQISVAAAHTLAGRLAERWGEAIQTPWPEIRTAFPQASTIAACSAAELREIGLTAKRAECLLSFAKWYAQGKPGDILDLPGIGPWTKAYWEMRTGADRDAFPAADLGVQKALGIANPGSATARREAEKRSQFWRPWRSYAVMMLWTGAAIPTGPLK
ncbi:MAG: AlkA N-terminal domain-containing protein [Bryobacter sp.]|nr:AlkA N-terminal domain-containing protein [Bryobacter sp.]